MLSATLALLLQGAVPARDSLSLLEAIRYARNHRADVATLSARVEEQRAGRRLAFRLPNPTVEFTSVAANETRRISASQSLTPLSRIRSDVRAATARVEAALADSIQRLADFDRDVARAFFGVHAAEARVRLHDDIAQVAESLAVLAERRAAAGDISELDRDQFVLEAVRVRLKQSKAREDLAVRSSQFVRQIGWTGETAPAAYGVLDMEIAEEDTAAVDPATVPRLRELRASAAAATHLRSSARWARMPLPGLLFERESATRAGYTPLTRIGVSVPLPLFSLGSEAVDAAASRAQQAEAAAREGELETERALTVARSRVLEARRRAQLASDTLLAGAVRLREGAVRLYEAGRTNVLQVLEALRAERDAQLTAVDELLALSEAKAEYAALSGRTLLTYAPADR
ncbi:MAG: hypothetical protein MNPFHGCM_01243 [Gemmatimonadaceae bacterium]|nr:hypothetical protein [Gemmatimonadaceae bacterium]